MSIINPAIAENTEYLIVEVRAPVINLKEGGLLDHSVSLRFFFWLLYVTFQAKNSVRNPPASTVLIQVLHWSHNARTAICYCREWNGAQRRTKLSTGRTMILALELLWLAKRHISRQSYVKQWRNQACSLGHFWIMLVWRHQIVRYLVTRNFFVKIYHYDTSDQWNHRAISQDTWHHPGLYSPRVVQAL